MRHVYSIYDVKAKLSKLLKMVKEGEKVIISDRGNPQFEIILYTQPENFEARIEQLKAQGVIRKAKASSIQSIENKEGVLERSGEDMLLQAQTKSK